VSTFVDNISYLGGYQTANCSEGNTRFLGVSSCINYLLVKDSSIFEQVLIAITYTRISENL
jgi:hypothetical protein